MGKIPMRPRCSPSYQLLSTCRMMLTPSPFLKDSSLQHTGLVKVPQKQRATDERTAGAPKAQPTNKSSSGKTNQPVHAFAEGVQETNESQPPRLQREFRQPEKQRELRDKSVFFLNDSAEHDVSRENRHVTALSCF